MQCTNNLSQMILAMQNYNMSHSVYPPGTIDEKGPIASEAQGYHHNWVSQTLPYLEEVTTYRHIDFSVGVYDEKNAEVRKARIMMLQCPSSPTDPDPEEVVLDILRGLPRPGGDPDRQGQPRASSF